MKKHTRLWIMHQLIYSLPKPHLFSNYAFRLLLKSHLLLLMWFMVPLRDRRFTRLVAPRPSRSWTMQWSTRLHRTRVWHSEMATHFLGWRKSSKITGMCVYTLINYWHVHMYGYRLFVVFFKILFAFQLMNWTLSSLKCVLKVFWYED